MNAEETYLRAILATIARQTFPPEVLAGHVLKNGGPKQFKAFNLCQGTLTQGEIAKEAGIDPANFSKTISRWVDAGIVVRVAEAQKVIPVHVYPLENTFLKKA
jgi:predicted transcriptional regulator